MLVQIMLVKPSIFVRDTSWELDSRKKRICCTFCLVDSAINFKMKKEVRVREVERCENKTRGTLCNFKN